MVEKTTNICDICQKSIAEEKCSLCKKDMCEGCGEKEVIGTIYLFLCENCSAKVGRVVDYKKFWNEFNKNENMDEKIVEYINRNLMLKNLGDDEDEEYEDEDEESFRKLKRRKTARRRIRR